MNISSPHTVLFLPLTFSSSFYFLNIIYFNTLLQLTVWDSDSVCIGDMETLQKYIKPTNLDVEPSWFVRLHSWTLIEQYH